MCWAPHTVNFEIFPWAQSHFRVSFRQSGNTVEVRSSTSAAAKGKAKGPSEKKGSAAKQRKPRGSAPSPEHADELAAAGVTAEEPDEAAASESGSGSQLESAEEDEGTSAKKAKKMAILKPPGAKQKPGKVSYSLELLSYSSSCRDDCYDCWIPFEGRQPVPFSSMPEPLRL